MNDYIAGCFSGIAQTLIGHPFDTVKVNLQACKPVQHFLKSPKLLLNGLAYPLLTNSLVVSVGFGSYGLGRKIIDNTFFGSLCAGMTTAPILFLSDLGKTKRQIGEKVKFQDFFKTKGYLTTNLREVTALTFYFSSYNYMKDELGWSVLSSGALAGLINWTTTYPIDVIRNRQLAYNISFHEAYKMKNLWSGYSVCAARALIVNAVGFYVFEEAKSYLKKTGCCT